MNKHLAHLAVAFGILLAALPVFAAEADFEKNLTVTGRPDLTVSNGSGTIHLSPGAPDQVHIKGHVRSTWGGDEDKVRELAAQPPIEQTGNIVRVGVHTGRLNNITIEYEIQVPPDSYIEASAGSGSIQLDGVGVNPRLSTGSGGIHATGLRGNAVFSTGSGGIRAEFAGDGDVKAEAGSGSIELRNVHGSLRAQTGSGSINIGGMPAGPWTIQTGSGGVDFWSGNSAFTLDAACGSGGIKSDRQFTKQGEQNRHTLAGSIAGGGPVVRIRTGSGGIRIH